MKAKASAARRRGAGAPRAETKLQQLGRELREASQQQAATAEVLWVTCGRRRGKDFLTLLQHWSGAVTCPAC
jgi:hypothetical protein